MFLVEVDEEIRIAIRINISYVPTVEWSSATATINSIRIAESERFYVHCRDRIEIGGLQNRNWDDTGLTPTDGTTSFAGGNLKLNLAGIKAGGVTLGHEVQISTAKKVSNGGRRRPTDSRVRKSSVPNIPAKGR